MTCSVVDCDRTVLARGYCSKHYQMWRKRGNPLGRIKVPRTACSIGREECSTSGDIVLGFCTVHYLRLKRHGDPLWEGRRGKWKDGRTKHPLYSTWRSMITRCTSPGYKSYPNYGGRGITVCDDWLRDFQAFVDHIGPRPNGRTKVGYPMFVLDRINNEGNYEPGNVRWADTHTSVMNRRPRRSRTR